MECPRRATIPEVEAGGDVVILIVQPVKLVDRDAIPHRPVQVTVPADSDANDTTLPDKKTLQQWGKETSVPNAAALGSHV